MHFTTTFFAVAAAALVAASPLHQQQPTLFARADANWTITAMTRTCNDGDTDCKFSFGIDTKSGPATPCTYDVKADSKASQAPAANVVCGGFNVSTGYSSQNGIGFVSIAILDSANNLIVWPTYATADLVNGVAVTPDHNVTASALEKIGM